MSRPTRLAACLLAVALVAACGDDSGGIANPDAAAVDATAKTDGAVVDASSDAITDAVVGDVGPAGADAPGDANGIDAPLGCLVRGTAPSGLPVGRGDCGPHPPADLCRTHAVDAGTGCDAQPAAGPVILWCSSPTDIWATDLAPDGSAATAETVLSHWDGTSWKTVFDHDQFFFQSAWGAAANDVWLVGHVGKVSWAHTLFVLHWNGTRLQTLQLPPNPTSSPVNPDFQSWYSTVSGFADGDVWIHANQVWRVPRPPAPGCLTDLP